MKRWKNLIALTLLLVLSVSVMTACSKDDTGKTGSSSALLASSEDSAQVVATVNGESITVADYQYYIYNTAMTYIYQKNPKFDGDISSINWKEKQESGKTLEAEVREIALNMAISNAILVQKGQEAGMTFPEEEKNRMHRAIEIYLSERGEEYFQLNMNATAITSREEYERLYELVTMTQLVEEDIQKDLGKYISDPAVLENYRVENQATVQHVLILSEGGKFENPEEVANEVLKKAKAGEDFAALIEEYNEDPGATAEGYTFGPGEMVQEFEEASFALDFHEISGIVETDYGYHIIKRLIGAAELKNYWETEADITKNEKVIKKISVSDIINAAIDAQTSLQEMSMSIGTETTTEGEDKNE